MTRRSDKLMEGKMKHRGGDGRLGTGKRTGNRGESDEGGRGGGGAVGATAERREPRVEKRGVRHAQSRVDSHMPQKIMMATKSHGHDYIRERGLHPGPDLRHARAKVDDHMSARVMRATQAHAHAGLRAPRRRSSTSCAHFKRSAAARAAPRATAGCACGQSLGVCTPSCRASSAAQRAV